MFAKFSKYMKEEYNKLRDENWENFMELNKYIMKTLEYSCTKTEWKNWGRVQKES